MILLNIINQRLKYQSNLSSVIYDPKKDFVWAKTLTGPQWNLLCGRDNDLIFKSDIEAISPKDDKYKKNIINTNKNKLNSYYSLRRGVPMDKMTQRGIIPIYYDLRIRNDRPFIINNNKTVNPTNLNILNKWTSKLKASNDAGNITTYSDDPSTVPLLRRDTMGFFNVRYNEDGTYTLGTNGIKWNGETYGKWTLAENMSWNPIKAYSVAEPVGQYLFNYNNYDTKNKIIQGTSAFANAYSNFYDGQKNIIDDYAVKEWMGLVDMTANWKDRTAMQNTVAGLSTITGLSQRYGFNNYLGGDAVVGGVRDALALYTFGNSVYQLGKNWDKMSSGERVSASITTIQSGFQAYDIAKPYYQQLYKYLTDGAEQQIASSGVQQTASGGVQQVTSAGVKNIASSGGYVGGTPGTPGSGYMGGTPGTPGSGYTGAPTTPDAGSTAGSAGSKLGGALSMGATSGITSFSLAKGRGKSDRTALGWGVAGVTNSVGGYLSAESIGVFTGATGGLIGGCAILGAQALEDFCTKNHVTAKDRQAGAMQYGMAGASMALGYGVATAIATGATIGSCIPVAGTIIGAAVGAVIGVAANSGLSGGHSREQWKRGLYRQAMATAGIYEKKGKGDPNHGHYFYQLADGQEYNVGIDGSGHHCLDINGNTKKVYDTSMIKEGDKFRPGKDGSAEMLPYNIDYTCNMDFSGSLMLAPLNALGLGGSNTKGAGEYGQTLGYMVNAVTSNVDRNMSRDNWDKMISNIKAGYERMGIKDKQSALDAMSYMYNQGNLTDEDWQSFQLALNLLYDKNGYDQAMYLMEQLGRPDQREAMEVTTETATEDVPESTGESSSESTEEVKQVVASKNSGENQVTSEEPVAVPKEVQLSIPEEGGNTETPRQMTEADLQAAQNEAANKNIGEQ